MSFADNLSEGIAKEMRLRILQQLAQQVDGRLSVLAIKRVLDVFGYRRDRDWIETQMRKLAALGAVSLMEPGGVIVARLEVPGRDHLEERAVLGGVARPHEVE